MHVLLVDDNLADVELVREVLADVPEVTLHTAEDGATALAFLGRAAGFEHVPDVHVVLLDVHLPGLDGEDVLRALRNARAEGGAVPRVLMFSSALSPEVTCSLESLGADAVQVKPTEWRAFERAVLDLLGLHVPAKTSDASGPDVAR